MDGTTQRTTIETCTTEGSSEIPKEGRMSRITSYLNQVWVERCRKRKKSIIFLSACIIFVLFSSLLSFIIIKIFYMPVTVTKVCHTDACIKETSRIRSYMNSDIDPCEDFYEFACGNFEKIHPIPDDLSRYETFNIASELVKQRLIEEMESDKGSDKLSPEPVKLFKKIYQKCRHQDWKHSLTSLRSRLKQMGGFPIGNIPVNSTWVDALKYMIANVENEVLIAVYTGPNFMKNTENVLTIYQPNFLIGKNELLDSANSTESKKVVKAYKEFMKKGIQLMRTDNLTQDNISQLDNMIDQVIDFEKQLLKFSTGPDERTSIRESVKNITLGEMKNFTVGSITFTYTEFINQLYQEMGLNMTVSSDESINIGDFRYIENWGSVLANVDPSVIFNYLGWTFMKQFAFTIEPLREAEFEYFRVKQGINSKGVQQLANTSPLIVGRIYVDRFFSPNDKESAKEIIHYVLEAFKDIVKGKDWMDKETIQASIQKANSISLNIGYPDWMKNDTALTLLYNMTDPYKDNVNSSTLDYILYVHRFVARKEFSQLREPVDKSIWFMSPSEVNAAFSMQQNSMTIPAAIFQGVFFSRERPKYLNYGAIGSVIGHEITHGFDDHGSQFDHTGNLRNWWTNQTSIQFKQKSECFIKQYNGIYDPDANMNLNGKSTLGENIADNGAIREAYAAYLLDRDKYDNHRKEYLDVVSMDSKNATSKWSKLGKNLSLDQVFSLLPDLPYNDEELFFISYAHASKSFDLFILF